MKDSSEEKKHKSKAGRTDGKSHGRGTEPPAAEAGDGGRESSPGGYVAGGRAGESGQEPVPEVPVPGEAEAGVNPAEEDSREAREPLAEERDRLLLEKQELEEKFLRLRADFDNFRKRSGKERANLIQYGNEALLRDLLPLIDNLERALDLSGREGDLSLFREGIELVLAEAHKTLVMHGVQAIEASGKEFDPNIHEAVQRVESDRVSPGTVVQEFQKGYLFRETLLRPARVAVSAAPSAEDAGAGDGSAKPRDEAGTAVPGDKIIN